MTQTAEMLDFGSLEAIEIPIELSGQKYVLCEADGNAGCAYRNALLKSADITGKGEVGKVRDLANVEPLLVSMTLFQVMPDNSRKPVSEATIRSWPARIVTKLYDKAKEISELDEAPAGDVPTQAGEPGKTGDASN